MDTQLVVICLLTAGINLIGTLAYAARIAGVRTRRIAMSFALFNILVLVSRTSNSFLGPFLAKRIEARIADGGGEALLFDFRMILTAATLAVALGIALVPTGQRLFARAIGYFQARGVGWGVLAANCLAQALITVGVLASLYAGYLTPEFRVTASQLSSVINGVATILLFALIDPQLSVMTDDVVEGRVSETMFRRTIVWISFSRLAGTLLAQVLFVPAAHAVATLANLV